MKSPKPVGVRIAVEEKHIPVREDVNAACEMLGLDPLLVANEGRFVAFVATEDAERALQIMRGHEVGAGSTLIGKVTERCEPLVVLKAALA